MVEVFSLHFLPQTIPFLKRAFRSEYSATKQYELQNEEQAGKIFKNDTDRVDFISAFNEVMAKLGFVPYSRNARKN